MSTQPLRDVLAPSSRRSQRPNATESILRQAKLEGRAINRRLAEAVEQLDLMAMISKLTGAEIPASATSWKTWCPLQDEHPNPLDRNFRAYPASNTAFCFEVHGLLTPTRLHVMINGCSTADAIEALATGHNLHKDVHWQARLAAAAEAYNNEPSQTPTIFRAELMGTLMNELRRTPGYEDHQLDEDTIDTISRHMTTAPPPTAQPLEIVAWVNATVKEVTK
jgi:hypothetical protein